MPALWILKNDQTLSRRSSSLACFSRDSQPAPCLFHEDSPRGCHHATLRHPLCALPVQPCFITRSFLYNPVFSILPAWYGPSTVGPVCRRIRTPRKSRGPGHRGAVFVCHKGQRPLPLPERTGGKLELSMTARKPLPPGLGC